jgi:hypothetical protein
MSQQADALFVEQYNSRLTHLYQPQGWLMQNMVMPEARIDGAKAYWPRMGRRTATLKQRGVPATPDNPTMDQVSADLKTWETFAYVYSYDLARTNVNEREAQIQAGAKSLGSAVDKFIIGLLDAAAPTSGTGFMDTSAGQLSAAQVMLLLGKWMDEKNLPADGELFAGITMLAHQMLMADKVYANSQWVGPELPFMKRTTGRSWNFVNWVVLPAEYFPVPEANKMDLFIWHRSNVGWTNDRRARMIPAWNNELGAWSLRQEADGAGVVLQNDAVARLRIKTNIASITIA